MEENKQAQQESNGCWEIIKGFLILIVILIGFSVFGSNSSSSNNIKQNNSNQPYLKSTITPTVKGTSTELIYIPTNYLSPTPTQQITQCFGATALCKDGTCSFSQNRRGTCSHHGGVLIWNP